jgi:hypothetical protein
VLLGAPRGPVGGLQNALPPLVGFRAKRPPAGSRLRCGSKQDRAFDLFRIARRRCPSGDRLRRSGCSDIGIDPRTGSHNAAVLDEHEQLVGELRRRGGRVCGTRSAAPSREDHTAVVRLLATRHHDLVAHRTRAICRLHAVLCRLDAGDPPRRLSATRAAGELRRIRPGDAVGIAADLTGYRSRVRRFPTAPRPLQRHCPDRNVLQTTRPPPPHPARQPPAERRDPHHRGHTDRARHARTHALPPQTR